MTLLKDSIEENLLIALKGGPGSGNFGHRGRSGIQGGSAKPDRFSKYDVRSVKFLNSLDDLKRDEDGSFPYFLTKDGKIVDTETRNHPHYMAALVDGSANAIKRTFGVENPLNDKSIDSIDSYGLVEEIVKKGAIRVRWSKHRHEVNIQIDDINMKSIERVRKLIGDGLIPVDQKYAFDNNDTLNHEISYLYATYDELMNAKRLYHNEAEFEWELKGGEGSGNFGHRGRAGIQGGSGPAGVSKKVSTAKDLLDSAPPSLKLELSIRVEDMGDSGSELDNIILAAVDVCSLYEDEKSGDSYRGEELVTLRKLASQSAKFLKKLHDADIHSPDRRLTSYHLKYAEKPRKKGGPGSGNFAHHGIPGHQGGSQASGIDLSKSDFASKTSFKVKTTDDEKKRLVDIYNDQPESVRNGLRKITVQSNDDFEMRLIEGGLSPYTAHGIAAYVEVNQDAHTRDMYLRPLSNPRTKTEVIQHEFGHVAWEKSDESIKKQWEDGYNLGKYRVTPQCDRGPEEAFSECYNFYKMLLKYGGNVATSTSNDFWGAEVYNDVDKIVKSIETQKGGPGSGNFGHSGRPGKQGGSAAAGIAAFRAQEKTPAFKKWFGKSKVVDGDKNPKMVYHGTTHEFSAFDIDKANVENYLGAGFYFTDNPEDASANYAGEGPDLTNRLETLADNFGDNLQYAIEGPFNEGILENISKITGVDPDEIEDKVTEGDLSLDHEQAMKLARLQLGVQHEGAIIPAYLKMENPMVIKPKGGTYFEMPEMDDDGNFVDEEEPSARMYLSIKNVLNDYDIQLSDPELLYSFFDGISAHELISKLKSDEQLSYHEDENGNLDSANLIGDMIANAGFDGVIMDAGSASFSNMKYVRGTTHYIIWDPKRIKSYYNLGKFDPNDPRILKGGAGSGNFGHSGRPGIQGGSAHQSINMQRNQENTPEFKRFFEGSKVVDKKGNPKPVYHGTKHVGFESFDISKQDTDALFGAGFYFTENPDVASGYASQDVLDSKYGLGDKKLSLDDVDKVVGYLKKKYKTSVDHAFQEDSALGRNVRRAATSTFNAFDRRHPEDYIADNAGMLADAYGRLAVESDPEFHKFLTGLGFRPTDISGFSYGLYPVYLSIKNPLDIDKQYSEKQTKSIMQKVADNFPDIAGPGSDTRMRIIHGDPATGHQIFDSLVSDSYVIGKSNVEGSINSILQKIGFDGITHIGGYITNGVKHRVWIAFNPEQVESYYGNQGTFSPDPSILKGGPGSGNYAHAGRPGKWGGSAPSGVHMAKVSGLPKNDAELKAWLGRDIPEDIWKMSDEEKRSFQKEIEKKIIDSFSGKSIISKSRDEWMDTYNDWLTQHQDEKYDLDSTGKVILELTSPIRSYMDFEIKKGVSEGKIDPQEAEDKGYDIRASEWKPLPDTLYHATTNVASIVAQGPMSRRERSVEDGGIGLGGGESDAICFTTDLKYAQNIERALHEAHNVVTGKTTAQDLVETARAGWGGVGHNWLPEFIKSYANVHGGSEVKEGDLTPDNIDDFIKNDHYMQLVFNPKAFQEYSNSSPWSNHKVSDSDLEERHQSALFDFYTSYATTREHQGGFEYPWFGFNDRNSFAKIDPKQFQVLRYKTKKGTMGRYIGDAEHEWRTSSGNTVKLMEQIDFFEAGDIGTLMGDPANG